MNILISQIYNNILLNKRVKPVMNKATIFPVLIPCSDLSSFIYIDELLSNLKL